MVREEKSYRVSERILKSYPTFEDFKRGREESTFREETGKEGGDSESARLEEGQRHHVWERCRFRRCRTKESDFEMRGGRSRQIEDKLKI